MSVVIQHYKEAVVNILGILGSISMLSYGFTIYQRLIDQMIAAIFYK